MFEWLKTKNSESVKVSSNIEGSLNAKRDCLINYIVKYINNKLTFEEMELFCALMIKYCKNFRHANVELREPEIRIEKMQGDLDLNMIYDGIDNAILIDREYLHSVWRKEIPFSDFVISVGHEMCHYKQNASVFAYDKLSMEKQKKIDEETKKSVVSYKNYFTISSEEIEILYNLLLPYLKDFKISSRYKTEEEFFDSINYGMYYTHLSEKEARDEGFIFAELFYKDLLMLKFNVPISLLCIRGVCELENRKQICDLKYKKLKKETDMFYELCDIEICEILEIVENIENKVNSFSEEEKFKYLNIFNFLIKTKTLEQKIELLRVSIIKGYSILNNILVLEFEKDINLKSLKTYISARVKDCFTNKKYRKLESLPYSSYCVDYSKILTREDFQYVIEETLNVDYKKAICLVGYCLNNVRNLELLIESMQRDELYDGQKDDFELNLMMMKCLAQRQNNDSLESVKLYQK